MSEDDANHAYATSADRPSDDRLRAIYNAVEPHIERRYGIPVVIADVPSPFTGDLDGAEIKVDHGVPVDEAVFIIAHLFGHTVQWNTDPDARRVGTRDYTGADEAALAELERYEQQACRYSLQLFHEAGVHDLDQWISDFAACDFAYLRHFYATGDKRDFREFWRDGAPLLTPLPIPDFHPEAWLSRWKGVVI